MPAYILGSDLLLIYTHTIKVRSQPNIIMASGPITSWEIDGETVSGSKITADGDCSQEIKRRLLLGRKAKTNLHIKKQRYHFTNRGPYRQSYGFSSNHVQYESWTIKKAEHWRTDAFELWSWRRLLRVLWTARRSNQSILKEINPEYSLEAEYSCSS